MHILQGADACLLCNKFHQHHPRVFPLSILFKQDSWLILYFFSCSTSSFFYAMMPVNNFKFRAQDFFAFLSFSKCPPAVSVLSTSDVQTPRNTSQPNKNDLSVSVQCDVRQPTKNLRYSYLLKTENGEEQIQNTESITRIKLKGAKVLYCYLNLVVHLQDHDEAFVLFGNVCVVPPQQTDMCLLNSSTKINSKSNQ